VNDAHTRSLREQTWVYSQLFLGVLLQKPGTVTVQPVHPTGKDDADVTHCCSGRQRDRNAQLDGGARVRNVARSAAHAAQKR
jgi:hypothetical protein